MGLKIIENLVWDFPKWLLLVALWLVAFGVYIAAVYNEVQAHVVHPFEAMLAMYVLLRFVWPGLLLPLMAGWTVLQYIFIYDMDVVDEWFPDIDIRTGITSFVIWIVRFIVLIVCSWFPGYYFTLGVFWVGYGVLEN